MKQVLRLAGILLAVTAVMAALLAGVNAITSGPILDAREEKTLAAIEAVLPGAGKAEEIPFTDETGLVRRVYATDAGYAVQTAPAGFGGEISLMVGLNAQGTVLGVSVISHAETPSLGAVAAQDNAAGRAFREQFVNQVPPLAVSKDGGVIDAITSATITSRAVTQGVNAAAECVLRLEEA